MVTCIIDGVEVAELQTAAMQTSLQITFDDAGIYELVFQPDKGTDHVKLRVEVTQNDES